MPYMLSCDSTTDLTLAQYAALDLHYVSLHFLLDGKEYPDDYGQSLPMKTFFDAMAAGATTGTSQVTTGEFELYFRQFLEQGSDILHVSLSSGLSGCYHSACAARDMLLEEFPERKIIVVDSLCGSGGAAILMLEAARQRDAGRTMEETAAWIEARRLHVHHWLFTPELAYFVRGGRVSAAAGWIGTLLRLCPVIEAKCSAITALPCPRQRPNSCTAPSLPPPVTKSWIAGWFPAKNAMSSMASGSIIFPLNF